MNETTAMPRATENAMSAGEAPRNELWLLTCRFGRLMYEYADDPAFACHSSLRERIQESCMGLMSTVAEAHQLRNACATRTLLAGGLSLLRELGGYLALGERAGGEDYVVLIELRQIYDSLWKMLAERLDERSARSA